MFNLLIFRFLYTFERETHNLEVLGSSPSWSTVKISNLEEIQVVDFSFCENNAKTIGLSSTPF